MCFVWISEQTAIISLYNINWLVFITEMECLLRGTDWMFNKCLSQSLIQRTDRHSRHEGALRGVLHQDGLTDLISSRHSS